jgi:hypothetical protein
VILALRSESLGLESILGSKLELAIELLTVLGAQSVPGSAVGLEKGQQWGWVLEMAKVVSAQEWREKERDRKQCM